MEITQFTYFQSIGGTALHPISVELTYGLERLALYLQNVDNFFNIRWNENLTYGDVYHRNEIEWSKYNFEQASKDMWLRHFDDYENEACTLIDRELPIPAYDFVLKASHAFNILDARGLISVTERTGYINRIRNLSCLIARSYIKSRKDQNFPLLKPNNQHTKNKIKNYAKIKHKFNPYSRKDFVLEIGSEELPATFVSIGCANLKKTIISLLEREKIEYEEISIYGTPRRIAIYVHGLQEGTEPQLTEHKGPLVPSTFDSKNILTQTGIGFFKNINICNPSLDDIKKGKLSNISIRTLKGADYLFVTIQKDGHSTMSILSKNLPRVILNIDFPKKMRWADLDIFYARPLKWILALFGNDVVTFDIDTMVSDRYSYGHPQLSPEIFSVASASEYVSSLRKHFIMVDVEERKREIISQLESIKRTTDSIVVSQKKVINQVLYLVEWPFLTTSKFDSSFLRAPKEVLISEMVEHQKYFSLANADGSLKKYFCYNSQ